MKKIITLLCALICTRIFISATITNPATPCDSPLVGDHSGAPGETNCSGCHSSPVNPDLPMLHFEVESGASQYKPDSTYLIHLKIKRKGHDKFGFVCTSLDPGNIAAGTFSLINNVTTRLFTSGGRKYVSHTPCGADNQDSIAWTYQWKAPSSNKGKIKIYMSMLVSNHDQALTGDTTYTRILELDGPPQSVGILQHGVSSSKSSVAPTIFSDGFTISFGQSNINEQKTFSIYNIQGAHILTNSTAMQSYYQKMDESFPAGVYFLKINSTGKQETIKVIKIH